MKRTLSRKGRGVKRKKDAAIIPTNDDDGQKHWYCGCAGFLARAVVETKQELSMDKSSREQRE